MSRLACVGLAWLGLMGAVAAASAQPPQLADLRAEANAQIRDYLRLRVERLAAQQPAAIVSSRGQWEAIRPQLRADLFDMLGLEPLPPRGELRATITGQVEREGVIVEKLHFQSIPGLYVTANFYRPAQAAGPLPTVLYLCGHGREVVDGVSVGNKVHYQHHGAWFARNNYCCLMIDTLQLGEIEGQHHGTYRLGRWWWINRGYTPAGVEAWNSIRALDYLATRPEVDMQKLGVTGRSGGGAYSWWVAALDDRPACFVPVAGITDLADHVVHDCIEGHCDCMFMVNDRGWDFATLAALAAPRPCLLANTDKDRIFPLGGVQRVHAGLRRIYDLCEAGDKLGLFISEGPHADTQELQLAAFRWLNRWLRDTTEPVEMVATPLFKPLELKVFAELPADEINTKLDERFVPTAAPTEWPDSLSAWQAQREALQAALVARCFADRSQWSEHAPNVEIEAEHTSDTHRLRIVAFEVEPGLRWQAFVIQPATGTPQSTRAIVLDDVGWLNWAGRLQAAFPGALALAAGEATASDGTPEICPAGEAALLIVPRGWGRNAWLDDRKTATHLPRRFVLTGTTVDAGRVRDVVTALDVAVGSLELPTGVVLTGRRQAAAIALLAGLLSDRVAGYDLTDLPSTLREGPYLLGIDRVLDMPTALALALPAPIALHTADASPWSGARAVAALYQSSPAEPSLLEIKPTP